MKYIRYTECIALLKNALLNKQVVEIDKDKRTFLLRQDDLIANLKIPELFPEITDQTEQYISNLQPELPAYLMIMVRAGAAALAFFEAGELTRHKVITAYMVRKKQGKAQLTYLKTKGKSRLGSRIRIQESLNFFVEIADKINSWQVIDKADKIALYCPPALKQYLFEEELVLPFNRDDSRIIKIPFNVKTPSFDEIVRINFLLSNGEMVTGETTQPEKSLENNHVRLH